MVDYDESEKKILSVAEMNSLLDFLNRQKKSFGRRLYFEEAISVLFPCTFIYFYYDENKFILCLPYDDTEENRARLKIIEKYFFDVTAKYEAFWQKHIGIIDFNKTMHIDKIAIY